MKAAILLRGISYFENFDSPHHKIKNVDFNRGYESFKNNIILPLRASGYNIDIYISTYEHSKMNSLVELYKPVNIYTREYKEIGRNWQLRSIEIGDMIYNGLSLIKDMYDIIIETRFDIQYKMRYTEFSSSIKWDYINFLHGVNDNGVDDNMHFFTEKNLELFKNSLLLMKTAPFLMHNIQEVTGVHKEFLMHNLHYYINAIQPNKINMISSLTNLTSQISPFYIFIK